MKYIKMVSITSIETKLVQKKAKYNCADDGSGILVSLFLDQSHNQWKTNLVLMSLGYHDIFLSIKG